LRFDSNLYGKEVASLLALDRDGDRLIPLVSGTCSCSTAPDRLRTLTLSPVALAGLWLYFSCFDECHEIVQDLGSPEASLWHAILHRQEPDSGNAAYWFRKAGNHAIFPALCEAAEEVTARLPEAEFRTGGKWDPYSFIMFCERARQQPGSSQEQAALEIQRAEWQLLFDHCARKGL
jgi:hypothetical protein